MIEIQFQNKPISVSIRHNAYYKLILLLAILKYCGRGKKAFLLLIHLVMWSLRNSENHKILKDFSKGIRSTLTPWSFEIGIEQVISLGLVYNFIQKEIVTDTLEFRITEEGLKLLNSIENAELFSEDIALIREIGSIQKGRISSANNNWSLL